MFDAKIDELIDGRLFRYELTNDGRPIPYVQALDLLKGNEDFRRLLSSLLANAPLDAFRWETPPVSRDCEQRPFEFVLLSAARFATRRPDATAYKDHFTADDSQQGIVTFPNLSGDSTLIVPSPRTNEDAYGHLAAFVRRAPESQVDTLWRIIAATVENQIKEDPIWLSTAGGGVAWLHIRLDSRPKYYGYTPYKETC